MKNLFLVTLFLCVLCAHAKEDDPQRRNFLAETYSFDPKQSIQEPTKALVLELIVISNHKTTMSDKVASDLERALSQRRYDLGANKNSLIYYAPLDSLPAFKNMNDREDRVASNELALKYLGGVELFKGGTFYFHGGLMRRINKNVSIGLKSFGHGAKGFAI